MASDCKETDLIKRLFTVEIDLSLDKGEDEDICNEEELSSLFRVPYHLEKEIAVSLFKTYVLCLDWSNECSNRKVVAGLSDTTCVVYDLETFSNLSCLRGHSRNITAVKFSSENNNVLYSSSLDGTIKIWDLRTRPSFVKELKDASSAENCPKSLLCFDVSSTDKFIVGGTEVYDGDAFLLFWDVRSCDILGGYWETHQEDITQVSFHSSKEDWIVSGSTDGLINVFDLSKDCEDNALLYCLNSESSVEKLGWFTCGDKHDGVSVITHMHTLQLWKADEISPFVEFSRTNITEALQRKSSDHCYIVDVHETSVNGELLLIAGSTLGRGDCLRLLKVQKKKLKQVSLLNGNKQIVRGSLYDDSNGCIVTGGESGLLSMWKEGPEPLELTSQLKTKSKSIHKKISGKYFSY